MVAIPPTVVASGLIEPQALAVDGSGNVYVADFSDSTYTTMSVYKETPSNGSYTTSTVVNGLYRVYALATDHSGSLYIAYVNTSAEVKAESDVCCTSANAVEIVSAVPAEREVLFRPDQFLGAHVRRETGRDNVHVWMGECHVHAGISPQELRRKAAAQPDAPLFIHPECGCATAALWQAGAGELPRARILSTGGMLTAARSVSSGSVLVATETGMLHQLRKANAAVSWEPVNEHAVCRYMKMTTPETLLRCLRDGTHEVFVEPDVANRARRAVEAMLTVGA